MPETIELKQKKETILIVDDSQFHQDLLENTLKDEYNVLLASTALEATEFLSKGTMPDLILLDIEMPEVDGLSLCLQLKKENHTKEIPIIFISGRSREDDEIKGLQYGAVDYIKKPYQISIVKMRVSTHLELKRSRDTLKNLSTIDGLTGIPNRRRFPVASSINVTIVMTHQ